MTKRERSQVAELLRCAADVAVTGDWGFKGCAPMAAEWTQASKDICLWAERAAKQVAGGTSGSPDADGFIAVMLEAALRVEDGSWPDMDTR